MPMPFLLASRSPQRVKLLSDAGYDFVAVPADIDEDDYPPDLAAAGIAEFLASGKALAVASEHPDRIVLGADTVVCVAGQLLGKPEDAAHAVRMLGLLSGGTHEVITGVTLIVPGGPPIVVREVSTVRMRALSAYEIAAYVASGQWRGKAGGYGIQDADPFVTNLGGSTTNIVGLPMERVAELLAAAGIRPG